MSLASSVDLFHLLLAASCVLIRIVASSKSFIRSKWRGVMELAAGMRLDNEQAVKRVI